MARHSVLYIQDPIIATDLAEMLTVHLKAVDIRIPTSADEALALMRDAVCIVTDKWSLAGLGTTDGSVMIPHLHIGTESALAFSEKTAFLDLPFTNVSVTDALTQLGLIASAG